MAALLLPFSSTAVAQQNAIPPAPHILVYGQAEARVIPNQFKISITIQSIELKANDARQKVAQIFDQTLTKLTDVGVGQNDIIAASLSVQPSYNYSGIGEQQYLGTHVQRKIDAMFNSNESLEDFLRIIEANENLSISGVQINYNDAQELKRALRKEAVKSSRQKAEALAEEYGARIKGLYSVSDVPPNFNYGVSSGRWPTELEWRHGNGELVDLVRVDVTGSRLSSLDLEHFKTGYVVYQDNIYAVFLIEDNFEAQ